MPQILRTDNNLLDDSKEISIPARFIPSFRMHRAIEHKVDKKILIRTSGGLGDIICCEPSIRYAVNNFKDSEISVLTEAPDMFSHLPLKQIFLDKVDKPIFGDYFVFDTMLEIEHLHGEFITHLLTHCVDYTALTMYRMQLPIKDREIKLVSHEVMDFINRDKDVVIHAGKGWKSKTFPKKWWDEVIKYLVSHGFRPILIGHDSVINRGTVDVETQGCLDLRRLLSRSQSVALVQGVKVVLTNDSSPLHMAASGDAWIGFITVAKHPDYITHWRHGQFGWRMENLSKGGMWEDMNTCPNNEKGIKIDDIETEILKAWLPDPVDYAEWAIDKLYRDRV